MSTLDTRTPLEKAHAARKQKIADGTYQSVRMNPVEKALANPRSNVMAIRAFCYQCMGGESVVALIRECASIQCPLHPHRPYQVKAGAEVEQDEADLELELAEEETASPL